MSIEQPRHGDNEGFPNPEVFLKINDKDRKDIEEFKYTNPKDIENDLDPAMLRKVSAGNTREKPVVPGSKKSSASEQAVRETEEAVNRAIETDPALKRAMDNGETLEDLPDLSAPKEFIEQINENIARGLEEEPGEDQEI
ncbi:MAG: hypothetical protein Q7S28_02515 [bacterium]|nr:hypothetical protein [bacterium]